MPLASTQDFSLLIPFMGPLELALMFIVVFPIMAILGGLIGIVISPLLVWVHKTVFGRTATYGIEEVHKSEKFKRTFQGLFPGLMAINFSLLISDKLVIQQMLIPAMWWGPGFFELIPQLITFMSGVVFTLVISYALFSGFWAISDSGIVFTNKKGIDNKGKETPMIVQSIGGWYNYLLKGYAGIGVIFAYYEIATLYVGAVAGSGVGGLFGVVFNMYIFLGYFIILPLFTIPAIIVIDVMRDRRIEFTRNFAAKIGIIDKVEIELKKIDK